MNLMSSLRYLVALHEHQHFGRAAKACHITQPALSNALRALEAEFKVVIVKRDRNYAGLTPEGERVLASAQFMLHEHAVLQQELRSDTHLPRGALRIGAVPTAVPIVARFAAMLQSQHPGILPVVLSMSSYELEKGLEDLSIDLALGYTERMGLRDTRLVALPQYLEHYFLLRRAATPHAAGLRIGPRISWKEVARLSLCLLTPDMHNRTIVDAAFTTAGVLAKPAIETNSILTMALSVVAGSVSSILPGALVGTVRGYRELEALPLISPQVRTPIGFMSHGAVRPSRALEAALALARDEGWLRHAVAHSGLLAV
ncbi:LysR substrate-binding domain-containing protein [Polaromonas sp.]|uniref:LysR family transcriptional regulator n=1 Tax=Polaromonas sp. TaxID=1869339 RepID=UPI00286BC9E7|nr:LysR substrate-binding domain-containing protein [Polaromonas sp.]